MTLQGIALEKWWEQKPVWSDFKIGWEGRVGNISIIHSFENLCCKKKRNEAIPGETRQEGDVLRWGNDSEFGYKIF